MSKLLDVILVALLTFKFIYRCIRLLRLYVLGDKEISFDFLSNQSQNFPSSLTQGVNYEDCNMNISIPIFTIHGNHDDVINNTSALDVLSSTGLINYFGQWKELTNIKVSPIILRKGMSKLALYGLNHIPDRRLQHLMKNNAFNISVPEVMDDMFCMFVLHQNRADRGAKNYIMENMLPAFLHLVIWGHEHDCRIDPEPSHNTFIIQPGSSVATSLSEGEAKEKKVGILEIRGKEFKLTPVALRTVRPFIFRSIELKEEELSRKADDMRNRVESFLDKTVKEMLAKVNFSGHARQPRLPLIRLRVTYDDNQYLINTKRFGQNYGELVANPDDMLLFKKNISRLKTVKHEANEDVLDAALKQRDTHDRVEDVVSNYFKKLTEAKEKLKLFNLDSLSESCQLIVDRDDELGATDILDVQCSAAKNFLVTNDVSEERVQDAITHFNERESKNALDEGKRLIESRRDAAAADVPSDDDSNGPPSKKTSTRGRGGRGRGASTSARGQKAQLNDSADTSTRGARGRGKKAAAPAMPSIAQRLSNRSTQNKSAVSKFLDVDSDDD